MHGYPQTSQPVSPYRPMRAAGLRSVCIALIATSGIRIDSINPSRITALIMIVAGYFFHHFVAERWSYQTILYYFAALFFIRYVFLMGGFGKRGFSKGMIAKYGEAKAWDRYELMTSVMFFQRGLCFGLLIHVSEGSITAWSAIAPIWYIGAGAIFAVIGLWINVAACQVIGIDTYFYKDLFLGRPVGDFKVEGPYKYFRNPMYGVGQLSAYGTALMAGSTIGLLATLMNQVIMYVFYYRIERLHIQSLFGKAGAIEGSPLPVTPGDKHENRIS